MSQEVVFNTEEAAIAQQQLDLAFYFLTHTDADYQAQTTKFTEPVQRLDGKWAYPCCPGQDYSEQTVEEIDPANYPQPEEI